MSSFPPLPVIVPVHLLDGRVPRSEAAAGGGVHRQDDLALVVVEVQLSALAGSQSVTIDPTISLLIKNSPLQRINYRIYYK